MSTNHVDGVAAVAARSAVTLRDLATKCASLEKENGTLRTKLASYERADQVRSIAKEMETRGLSPELSFDEKIASISKYDDLSRVQEAIKLAGGGSLSLAKVDDSTAAGTSKDAAEASFQSFCLTGHSGS